MSDEGLQPTMELRFVDVSSCPELCTQKVLQQKFVNRIGESRWVAVPFVGHVSSLSEQCHD